MKTPVPKEEPQAPKTLMNTVMVGGVKYLAGTGPVPAEVMIVGQNPSNRESERSQPFTDRYASKLRHAMAKMGFDISKCRLTYAVKYATYQDKQPKASDLSACRDMLADEIARVNPRLIVAMGMPAFQAVMGTGYKMSQFQGVFIESKRHPGRTVLPIWHPGFILRNPQMEYQFDFNLGQAMKWLAGEHIETPAVQYTVVDSIEAFEGLMAHLTDRKGSIDYIIADCEWEGELPVSPGAYLRTLQLNVATGENYIMRFYPEPTAAEPIVPMAMYPNCVHTARCMALFKDFLVRTGIGLAGHAIVSDGRWMKHHGCDIRDHVFYDTMLAEHLIDNSGRFSLSDVCIKYTSYGMYEAELAKWKKENAGLCEKGYGAIPERILFPYGALDVECIRPIITAQLAHLDRYNRRRGFQGEYTSLFDSVMTTGRDLYELEETGMRVDPERLKVLTEAFHKKLHELEGSFTTMVISRGFPASFNHRSVADVRSLMFEPPGDPSGQTGGLGLIPLQATGKPAKSWAWVLQQPAEIQKQYSPSVDKNTLEILGNDCPPVRMLLNIRKIDQMCKNFLRGDDTGGIPGCLRPDGRLHPEFGQITDSGRLTTRGPNCQNFSKAAERFFKEIFGEKECPPPLRSVVIPEDGHVFVEADFIQAELFVLAGISGDDVMMSVLATPGKDMHDMTAVSAFRLQVLLDGRPVDEQWLLDLAAKDMREFEKAQRRLSYLDAKGRLISRSEFKEGIRVSAKAINFGENMIVNLWNAEYIAA